MKKYIVLALIFMLLILIIPSFLNSSTELNSKNKIGDKIKVFDKQNLYEGRLYLFADESSCFVCIESLKPFVENITDSNKIEVVLFISNSSEEYINKLKKANGWKFKIVSDQIELYKNFYNVLNSPFYYFLNNEGEILAMDKIGGDKYNSLDLVNLINKDTIKLHNINVNLKMIKKINLSNQNNTLFGGRKTSFLYDNTKNRFIVINPVEKNLFVSDSNGIIIKTIDMNKFKNVIPQAFLSFSWFEKDSIILCADVLPKEILFYKLNINTNKTEVLNMKNADTNLNFSSFPYYDYINQRIFVSNYPKDWFKYLNDDFKASNVFDKNGKFIKSFGKADSIFYQNKMNIVFNNFYCSNQNNTYIVQDFSKILYIIDSKFNLVSEYKIDYDLSYKYYIGDLDPDGDPEY